jgi:hypothetical protein
MLVQDYPVPVPVPTHRHNYFKMLEFVNKKICQNQLPQVRSDAEPEPQGATSFSGAGAVRDAAPAPIPTTPALNVKTNMGTVVFTNFTQTK